MKQDKIFEATRKATEMPLEFTHSLIEQSKKLCKPSPKATRIGTAIGSCIGIGLFLTGTFQIFTGKHFWALGTLFAGAVTIVSNLICRRKNEKQV
jgi:hypothetical protein